MQRILTVMLVGLFIGLFGCEKHDEHAGHDHGGHVHEAPHGGTLTELGDHFANVEAVLDKSQSTLTLHILDAHAESGVRLSAASIPATVSVGGQTLGTLEFAAVASTLTGEKVGDSSQFAVKHAALASPSGAVEVVIPQISVLGRAFKDVKISIKPP